MIVTGGIDARIWGVVVRSREPLRALSAGLVLLLIHAFLFRRELTRDLGRVLAIVRARASAIAAVLALAAGAHGIAFGTFSVGGADAYGYVNQAYDWTGGMLPRPIAVDRVLPFESSERMQAPLGYREGREAGTIVPTYAPGLPLLMALALILCGPCGPFLVVPVTGALFVWVAFRLGARAGGSLVGLAAALAIATSPVFLFQSVWPMSDVPAGAAWTAAALFATGSRRRSAAASGLFAAVGVLIRPNLLPVALIIVLFMLVRARPGERPARVAVSGAALIAAVLFVGWLNALWFGSPLNSGYGAAGELYGWSNVTANLKLYPAWMWQSHPLWLPLAVLALVPRLRRSLDTPALVLCTVVFGAVVACYVSYAQFEVWWYLRFLLPGFGALAVLAAAGLVSVARVIPRPFGALAGVMVLSLLAIGSVTFAARQGVFGGISASERRYAVVGAFTTSLPDHAALVAVQHSGSLRFHSGRRVVRFDTLEYPRSLQLVPALQQLGHHPFLVIDDSEAASVRTHFGIPEDAPLPWPIRARMRDLGGVTVYDLAVSPSNESPIALEPGARGWCDAVSRAPLRP